MRGRELNGPQKTALLNIILGSLSISGDSVH